MVSTRNKDYGDPQPLKRKKRQHPCTEFTLFPKLPCELRLMIWQASMTPRLIAVGPKGLPRPLYYHSRKILPALFSVNKDSRYCAIRHYTLRFTITLTVDETGIHRWDCPEFRGRTYHANAVMCPDDTLGFIGWETLNLGHGHRFRVSSANGEGPWKSFPSSPGEQPAVKKLAFLGRNIAQWPAFVRYLNSEVSLDLDSILHAESTNVRVFEDHTSLWYSTEAPFYFKDQILIQSLNFRDSLQDWGHRLIYRARHRALALWDGAPDILAFQLGKKPKTIFRPRNFVPADSVHELYRVLPHSFVSGILDDFYRSQEYKWSLRHPNRAGF